jgi:hypothetical protein
LIAPYTFTQFGTTRNTALSLFHTHFLVHRYTRTSVPGLHKPYPGNGFITVSLALQITHDAFLSFILNDLGLPFPKPDTMYLDYSSILPATPLLLYYYSASALLYTSYDLFALAPWNTPSSIVQNMMLTSPLPSNGYHFLSAYIAAKCLPTRSYQWVYTVHNYEPFTTTTHPHNLFQILSPETTN